MEYLQVKGPEKKVQIKHCGESEEEEMTSSFCCRRMISGKGPMNYTDLQEWKELKSVEIRRNSVVDELKQSQEWMVPLKLMGGKTGF